MPERRNEDRPDSPDRRDFPRPPLWLNLALIIVAAALFAYARHHRTSVTERYAGLLTREASSPAEINRIKAELVEMDLTEQNLKLELESRLKFAEQLKSKDFYLSLDTSRNKLVFNYGNDILREMDVEVGAPRTIKAAGRTWTFVPLKGGFKVQGKSVGLNWKIPAWVYAMNGVPLPAERPVIENGLGKYVIFLPNDYVIHSPPAKESPLKSAKPGSFMVPAEDLEAIWPRINSETSVFVF